jgi:two-component system, OmpR family, phosphate regulon sensor histidine kinase PhoR
VIVLRFRISLREFILGGCLAVVVCTLAFQALVLGPGLRNHQIELFQEELERNLKLIREIVLPEWSPGLDPYSLDHVADRLSRQVGLRVSFIMPDGLVVGDSEVTTEDLSGVENHARRNEIQAALKDGLGFDLRYSRTIGVDFLYAAVPLMTPENPELLLRLAMPLSSVKQSLGRIWRLILETLILGMVLSVIISFLVVWFVSRPLRKLTQTVIDISKGDLNQRVKHYPIHEVGELGQAFDRMADHLQETIESVTRARDRLEIVLRSMIEAVLVTDDTGRITLVNHAFVERFSPGRTPIGLKPVEVLRSPDLMDAIEQVVHGEPVMTLEVRQLGPEPRIYEVVVSSLAKHGRPVGVVAIFHDASERKKIDRMRRDFVANVSHELRTPLAAIRAAVETLLDGALENPKFAKQFTGVIDRHSQRLQHLVSDLLDLSKLESMESGIARECLSVEDLVRDSLSAVREIADDKGIALKIDLNDPEMTIEGDGGKLQQALVNLLQNAVKYGRAGGEVTLSVSDSDGEITFAVKDNGIGMSSEELPRIFERFYRVDKNRSRQEGGTGLGLAIVKHIVQAHQGRLDVESRLGKGSTFKIILPQQNTVDK